MNHLALFARWPEPGKVKTRLTPALPAELACRLYQAMLHDALETGRDAAANRRYLYWADAPRDRPWSQVAREAGFVEALQHGRELGARLEAAFDDMLAKAGERALVIGADSPELGTAGLDEAFRALDAHDLVLGPTRDGGYYLVGLSRRAPELFRGVAWGSEQVLARTLEAARVRGLSVRQLDALDDVDTPEDLVGLATRCFALKERAPRHTTAALERLGLLPAFRA